MSIHPASLKGKRSQNEDKHDYIVNLDKKNPKYNKDKAQINYYAVYDGHGGKSISNYLYENMPKIFMDKRIEYPLKKNFVKNIYSYIQNDLKTNYKNESMNTGSTCCIVIHYQEGNNEYLNVLNTGDSRCIICKNNIAIPLTKDHKPNWPEEKARIESLGGEIYFDGWDWRIGDLSVSRAFGDVSSEPFLTCMPDIFRYKLTKNDKFIVLSCDGLYEANITNDDVVNFVLDHCYDMTTGKRKNEHINIGKKLAEWAIMKGSSDNISIVLVFFE